MSRVLIVDPDEATAATIGLTVRALGYDFDVATDGRAALTCAAGRAYCRVLFRERLPDMDGMDCFHRAGRHCPGLTGVMLAEVVNVRTVFDAVRGGVRSVLPYPPPVEEVARVFREPLLPPQRNANADRSAGASTSGGHRQTPGGSSFFGAKPIPTTN